MIPLSKSPSIVYGRNFCSGNRCRALLRDPPDNSSNPVHRVVRNLKQKPHSHGDDYLVETTGNPTPRRCRSPQSELRLGGPPRLVFLSDAETTSGSQNTKRSRSEYSSNVPIAYEPKHKIACTPSNLARLSTIGAVLLWTRSIGFHFPLMDPLLILHGEV